MFCAQCGEQNSDESSFCSNCGAALTQPVSVPERPLETVKTSGLAVASLVCGIIGFFFVILSILAIIFGAIAINQTRKNPDLKGRGMAVWGLVLGIIGVVYCVVALILIFIQHSHSLF